MSDIAKHVGVSATTVSLVLNEGPGSVRFSEKTRLQVLQAAEELGYRSNRMARAMRTGNTRMLGILGGRTSEEHVGRMLEGALEAADEHGYTLKLLRLHAIGNNAQQAIRNISELRLMGAVALHLPDLVLEALYSEAEKCGTPLVLMNTQCVNSSIPRVTSDDEAGFAQGVDHLVKLGHSRIALVRGGGETTIGIVRLKAFKQALARHGLKLNAGYVGEGSFHHRLPSEEAARALLSLPVNKRPTAIFCSSDLMAMATLKVAHELRIDVPSQLSVVGFANMRAADYASPALTTIEEPFTEIGRTAVNMLLDLIDKRGQEQEDGQGTDPALTTPALTTPALTTPALTPDDTLDRTRLLPTRLIERDSTAPPPGPAS